MRVDEILVARLPNDASQPRQDVVDRSWVVGAARVTVSQAWSKVWSVGVPQGLPNQSWFTSIGRRVCPRRPARSVAGLPASQLVVA